MAGLADLRTGPQQEIQLRRAVQFLEKAVDFLRCPVDLDEVDEGDRPSPCVRCYAGDGRRRLLGPGFRHTVLRWATAMPPSACPVFKSWRLMDGGSLSMGAYAAPSWG